MFSFQAFKKFPNPCLPSSPWLPPPQLSRVSFYSPISFFLPVKLSFNLSAIGNLEIKEGVIFFLFCSSYFGSASTFCGSLFWGVLTTCQGWLCLGVVTEPCWFWFKLLPSNKQANKLYSSFFLKKKKEII